MRMLVVGAGMYVTGRRQSGHGTVLASLAELSKHRPVGPLVLAARDPRNADVVASELGRINTLLGSRLAASYRSLAGVDLESEVAELCGSQPFDAAIVALPDDLHAPALRALLKAGVPSLVVKPFVPTIQEGHELVRLQSERHVYGAVEFHKRLDESNLFAKATIAKGALGRLLYVSVAYSQKISIPTVVFREWAARTNIFQYLGVHYADLVYFLTGFQPRRLTAYGTHGTLRARGIDTFDSVHVASEWRDPSRPDEPFFAHFDVNWIDPDCSTALSDQKFIVVGTQGRLECDQKNRGIVLVQENQGVTHANPYFADFLPGPDGVNVFQGYGYRSIAQFVEDVSALKAGTTNVSDLEARRPTFRQALVSTAIVQAVNEALDAPLAWRDVNGAA